MVYNYYLLSVDSQLNHNNTIWEVDCTMCQNPYYYFGTIVILLYKYFHSLTLKCCHSVKVSFNHKKWCTLMDFFKEIRVHGVLFLKFVSDIEIKNKHDNEKNFHPNCRRFSSFIGVENGHKYRLTNICLCNEIETVCT